MFCSRRCDRAACATSSAVHGSRRLGADVQEQRAVGPQHPRRGRHPRVGPLQVVGRRQRVLVAVVVDAQVVGRRRHDDVHAVGRQLLEDLEAVGEVELAPSFPGRSRRRVAWGFRRTDTPACFGAGGRVTLVGRRKVTAADALQCCGRMVTARLRTPCWSGGEADRGGQRQALRGNRVVAAMAVAAARLALFLDVGNFAAASPLRDTGRPRSRSPRVVKPRSRTRLMTPSRTVAEQYACR